MRLALRSGVSVVLVGAGVLAGAPPTPPPGHIQALRLTSSVDELITSGTSDVTSLGQNLADVLGPYQNLVTNTAANLQSIAADWLADPLPFPRQMIANEVGYVQTIVTALQNGARDLVAGLPAFGAGLQTTLHDFVSGDITGAAYVFATSLINLFVTGVTQSLVGFTVHFTPLGPLGDVLPIVGVPGDMAQNFANVIGTSTSTSIVLSLESIHPTIVLGLVYGLPLAIGLDALGTPLIGLGASAVSLQGFVDAVHSGNLPAAFEVLVDAPAIVTNASLNGEETIYEPVSAPPQLFESITANIPVGGLLTPLRHTLLHVVPNPAIPPPYNTPYDIFVAGTPTGGLAQALVNYLPQQLAAAIDPPGQSSAEAASGFFGALPTLADLPNLADISSALASDGALLAADLGALIP